MRNLGGRPEAARPCSQQMSFKRVAQTLVVPTAFDGNANVRWVQPVEVAAISYRDAFLLEQATDQILELGGKPQQKEIRLCREDVSPGKLLDPTGQTFAVSPNRPACMVDVC